MSIARRVTARRLLGTGAAALTLTAVTTGAAWAQGASGGDGQGTPGGNGWGTMTYTTAEVGGAASGTDRCEFSLDGVNFQASVRVDDQNLKPTGDGKVHIKVRVAGDATTCTTSLASYLTQGATHQSSGEQAFLDFDTVTVKPGQTDSLDIAVPDAGCFAQVDLYRGAVKFDGVLDAKDGFEHGELPKGPDRPVIKEKLITAWNGGAKGCSAPENPPPAEPQTPVETPEEEPPAKPEEPQTPPTPETPDTPLAETGGGNAIPIAIGAAALLAAGGGIFVVTRRRSAGNRG